MAVFSHEDTSLHPCLSILAELDGGDGGEVLIMVLDLMLANDEFPLEPVQLAHSISVVCGLRNFSIRFIAGQDLVFEIFSRRIYGE